MSSELNQSIETLRTVHVESRGLYGRLSPLPKVVFTIGHLILTVSIGPYDWCATLIFAIVPYFLAALGGVSPIRLLKLAVLATPLVLCAGIGNCFFDVNAQFFVYNWPISGGLVSLFVLSGKTLSSVGIALLLGATTPMSQISRALTSLRVPCLFVLQIQLLFRYLLLTLEEARNVLDAYALRNPDRKIIPVQEWGPLVGQLFVRTVRRSNMVYLAMQCRLFSARNPLPGARPATVFQWLAVGAVLAVLAVLATRS